jgi:hypothetical protein
MMKQTHLTLQSQKIKYIQELENNKIIRISNTLLAEKRRGIAKNISLKDATMDDRAIAMIAYNFLNLIILNSIYTDRLNFLREFIKEGKSSNRILIEHLRTTAETYGLFHRIFSKTYENEIIINIILFDYLVYRFHLKGFGFYDPVLVYLEDLKNNNSLYSPSIDEAKKNIYYLFKFKSK